jgi:hypothetical protein
MLQYIIPILLVSFLSAGWVVVQLIARKMKTKNHFDNLDSSSCGQCTCGGAEGDCPHTDSK